MMKKFLIGILILSLLYNGLSTVKLLHKDKPNVIVQTDTIYGDTVYTTNTIYKSIVKSIVEYNTDTIFIPTDTTELINRYKDIYSRLYASKTYLDTLKNDSSATVILSTHISRNSLDSLNMQFKNNRIITINNTTINNIPLISAGLLLGYNNISPIVSYNINSKFNVIGSYNVYQNIPSIGVIYNIK